MRKRFVLGAILLITFAASIGLMAQSTNGNEDDIQGIPKLCCSVRSSADSLFFRGNDYQPNQITITITITNCSTGADTARLIDANVISNTRFLIQPPPLKRVAAFLLPGEAIDVTFILDVADARATDGFDTLRTLVTAVNGASVVCEKPIWVEHEYFPKYSTICSKQFTAIVFEDALNDYNPNPFKIRVGVTNIGDGASDSTLVQYLGTRGVSIDPSSYSVQMIGTLNPGETKIVEFDLRAVKRTNDTTVSLCFQVQGKGGYKRKSYIDSCCQDIFIPLARQAVYQLGCRFLNAPNGNPVTFISFTNHKYQPDPFFLDLDISNIGTALGKDVKAQLILPPSISPAAGETLVKDIPGVPNDLNTGANAKLSWSIRPAVRFKLDTLNVCVKVYDKFDNFSTTCCTIIIDSIRSAVLDVSCSLTPDSILIDSARGLYNPDIFLASFLVCNVGSDYADSLQATIVIQSPDVIGVEPFAPIKRKVDYSPSDTLGTNSCFLFTWDLQALPRAVTGWVTIKFKAEALNAQTRETECQIYIPKLDAPDIDYRCEILDNNGNRIDSVKFDPLTGGYSPPLVTYRLYVWNPGGGLARNVEATLSLPTKMLAAAGEVFNKFTTPRDIGPKDTAIVEWRLVPLGRDVWELVSIGASPHAENVPGTFPKAVCDVWVSPLPKTLALILPQDPVGYYLQESPIVVPIYVDAVDGKNIGSIDLELDYNVDINRIPYTNKVVTFAGFNKTNTISSNWNWQLKNPVTDTKIGLMGSGAVLASDANNVLLFLEFWPEFGARTQDELKVATTQLLWPPSATIEQTVVINNGKVFPRTINGMITVSDDCLRPLNAGDKYIISQNKPNPFNPTTTIEYSIPVSTPVRIVVFDALGRTIRTLVNDVKTAGKHAVIFNAEAIPSGLYFYRIETPNFTRTMKMIIAK